MYGQDILVHSVHEKKFVQKLKSGLKKLLSEEIDRTIRYSDQVYYIHPLMSEDNEILSRFSNPCKINIKSLSELPNMKSSKQDFSLVLDGSFNYTFDIYSQLTQIWEKSNRHCKILAICYNPYLKWFYGLLNKLGLRTGPMPHTFLKKDDLFDLCQNANFEITRHRRLGAFPFYLFGLGKIINGLLNIIPGSDLISLLSVITLRPIIVEDKSTSLSIIIPARNEKGNIENALKRIPQMNVSFTEVIFVEGHSTDETWEEIKRVVPLYEGKFRLKYLKQTGKGKIDAVRVGFDNAEGDILTILDADLTMPPEMLPRFVDAYKQGRANFVNGSRLLYEMEGEAMQFLNKLGNIFFAKSLSFVLQTRLCDSLCGTKLLSAKDYKKIKAWRNDFGDFDPFGDFELLFPASMLGMGVINIPIRYLARTYGSTNIRRFYHGAMLAKMTLIGFTKIRL